MNNDRMYRAGGLRFASSCIMSEKNEDFHEDQGFEA